jgi:hypothetical protein
MSERPQCSERGPIPTDRYLSNAADQQHVSICRDSGPAEGQERGT